MKRKTSRSDTLCKNCGKGFYISGKAHQKFCCLPCAREYNSKHPSPNLSHPRPEKKTGCVVKCEQCGVEVYKPKNQIERAKHYFCSTACSNIFQGRNKVQMFCKICGVKFSISPSFLKFGNRQYCSLVCRDKDLERYEKLLQLNQSRQEKNPSRLDVFGYSLLDRLQVDYKKQYMIDGLICVDSYIPSSKLIIQFDGDYWHGNTEKFPVLDYRQIKRKEIDRKQNQYFLEHGYNLIRLWHAELKTKPEEVLIKILELL